MSFHVHSAELAGLQLIEASAGTGKTWTIAALYARLILEKSLTPEQILVVTYTRAATAELRGRIRGRLASLTRAFELGDSPDEFERDLLMAFAPHEHAGLAERLRSAVSGFDAAAVFTIHGFCQHALGEHALAAGAELGRTFIANEGPLLQWIADEAWKAEVAAADADWLRYLMAQGQTPDAWVALLGRLVDRVDLQIDLPPAMDRVRATETFQQAFAQAAEAWRTRGAAARSWLLAAVERKHLSGSTHRLAWVETSLGLWSSWLAGAPTPLMPGKPSPAAVKRLYAATLQAAYKGEEAVPEVFTHFEPLVAAAEAYQAAYAAQLAALHAQLLETMRTQLHARKATLGVMSYHDLLLELDTALAGDEGEVLADALATRYRAALIDEFQDTDPLQFRIFQRVFTRQDAPCFLVGDPKQAIYAFRGAELHAYLDARKQVPYASRHTLPVNRRSTPELVRAVSAVFGLCAAPFLIDELDYPVVSALPGKPVLYIDGEAQAALGWAWLGEGLGKGAARAQAIEATADRIAALLQPGVAQLGERPLSGGDIAVLANKHSDLQALHEALTERGVASVRIGRESVFASDEARDLLQVLAAMATPTDTGVRTALVTVTMALDAAMLGAALNDETTWEHWWNEFQRWHFLLHGKGAMAALNAWLVESGAAARLMELRDGERRLTNLLHVFELCETALAERGGVAALLAWYRQELSGNAAEEDDERLMRLESDAARVRLVTVHASKGLEFPVVFCPFLWDGQLLRKDELPLCYENQRAVLDLGSPREAERRLAAEQERLAEKLRLLYVALTRPISACFVAWGEVAEMATSALAWLLAGGEVRERDVGALRDELEALIAGNADGMAWLAAPSAAALVRAAPTPNVIEVATLTRPLSWQWRMSSFSALTAGLHDERPDHDLTLPSEDVLPLPTGRFDAFPAGPRAGVCLHTLFEDWDFCATDRAELEALATRLLRDHGFDPMWAGMAADIVQSTLTAPMVDGACLQGLAPTAKLVELEFTYRLQPFAWPRLAAVLADPAYGLPPAFAVAAQALTAPVASGYLKGFIDLACQLDGRHYVLDWKSNRLDRYDAAMLTAEMAGAHYYLQALIYCVALHRYLRWRQPAYDYARDFGGAIYVFLRGMDAAVPGQGIWHYCPPLALIEALETLLCGDAT